MWRDFGWAAGRVLMMWVPAAAFVAYVSDAGVFPMRYAVVFLVLVMAGAIVAELVSQRFARSMMRDATVGFGPEAASGRNGQRTDWRHRLNPMAVAIQPAGLLLDRGSRDVSV